jgi:chromosome segregation ATPase
MENLVITINGLEYVQKSQTLHIIHNEFNKLQDKYIELDATYHKEIGLLSLELEEKQNRIKKLKIRDNISIATITEKNNKINELEQKIAKLEDKIEELETNCEVLSFENNSLREGIEKIDSVIADIL